MRSAPSRPETIHGPPPRCTLRQAQAPANAWQQGRTWIGHGGVPLTLPPLRSDDTALLSALLDDGLSRHCRFLRFHGSLGRLSAPRLAQLACADFVRHHAWVVTAHEGSQTLAVAEARFWVAADGRCAEFALSIADAWQAQGLGTRLLQTLAGAACEHGVKRLHGSVLGANTAMFALLRRCGFGCTAAEDASGTVLAERWLGSETSEAEPETRRGRT